MAEKLQNLNKNYQKVMTIGCIFPLIYTTITQHDQCTCILKVNIMNKVLLEITGSV